MPRRRPDRRRGDHDRRGAGRRRRPGRGRAAEPRVPRRSSSRSPATRRCSASRRASIPSTGARLSTLVRGRPVAVMSGPNMAEEVAAGLPGATVIASEDAELAHAAPGRDQLDVFRVYVNDDLVGVELCAAAKNVIALAAGACDGIGARRQREGGADHARARGDGASRRGGRRRPGDVLRPRGHGRPDRHLLASFRAATAAPGELIAAGRDARGGGSPRSARSSRGSRPRRCCATSRTGWASSCRSPRASAPCSRAARWPSSPPG